MTTSRGKENTGQGEKKDLFVEYTTDRRTGCYLSRFQVSCLILGNLFILCTAVALVAFVKKERVIYGTSMPDALCSCETPKPYANATLEYYYVKNQTASVTAWSENLVEVENTTLANGSVRQEKEETKVIPEEEVVAPAYEPWKLIRLSRDLLPLLYDIYLKVDLEKLTYRGSVDMYLNCTKNSRFIIFHISHLYYEKNSVRVVNNATSQDLEIVTQFRYVRNQFFVIELRSELSAGTVYRVSVGYYGYLHEDLRGIYLSKYVTPSGDTR